MSHNQTLGKRSLKQPVGLQLKGMLKTQGGGHGKIHRGVGCVPSIAKPLIEREEAFYKLIKSFPLQQCIPKSLGSQVIDGKGWLFLEDLTAGMSSPCIADLKLGTRSFEVNVPQEKAAAQLSHILGTTTASHAIRCIDICIRRQGDTVSQWDRKEGRKMTAAELRKVLRVFLPGKRREEFNQQIRFIQQKLSETYQYLPNLRLYSASVLAIYDSDKPETPMRVTIIDFAHAYIDVASEGGNPADHSFDDNSLKGLQNLLNMTSKKSKKTQNS